MIVNPKTIALYKRLLKYIRPYKFAILITIIALIITAAMTPLLPALLKNVVDESLIAQNQDSLIAIPLLIILVFTIRGIAEYASRVAGEWVAHKAIHNIRADVFAKFQKLSDQTHKNFTEGKLLSKVTYDVPQVGATLSQAWIIIIKQSLIVIGLIGFLLYTSWQLTVLIIAMAPILAFVFNRASKLMRSSNKSIQSSMGELTQHLGESLKGHKEIKMFNAENFEKNRFHKVSENFRQHTMKSVRIAAANVPIIQFIASISLAAVIYLASVMSSQNNLTAGDFVAFITAMVMIFDPIRRLTDVNATIQRGMAAAESIFEILDFEEEPDHGTQSLNTKNGDIKFHSVTFSYGDRQIFKDLNLNIKSGSSTALVGASGSGKSTLINLITRFYPIHSGSISIGNQNINDVKLTDLRKHISYVSQNVILFNDTVRANIRYGSPEATENMLIKAAKKANALDFIQALPNGLDTIIGQDGASLSGGQRQRIAIARAFLKDSPILILDEATSALDNESEAKIQSALEELRKNKTFIIIAHRLSTIENADTIVVLDKGNIIEQGNHNHLLEVNGQYAMLYNNGKIESD